MTDESNPSRDRLQQLQDASFSRANAATSSSFGASERMRAEELEAFIRGRQYATVATTRKSGRPHATPSAFYFDGDTVWMPTTAGARRLANIDHLGYSALVISQGEGNEHAAVVLEGEAHLVDGDDLPAGLQDAWMDKFGWAAEWAAKWIAVTPERLFSYAASGWRAEREARQ